MDAAEAFRKNAEACSQMADKSADPWDRANWIRLAESWTRLAKTSNKSSAKSSDASRPAATASAAPVPTLEPGARRKRGQNKSPGRRRASRKAGGRNFRLI
jgi:hypothetical protein